MRIKSALKNSFFGMAGQVVLILVGFFCQRTMNLLLGAELVGMNGVISNIIAILSVSELGISTAVIYHLYAAVAAKNQEQIAGLMHLYRKAYLAFAVVIFSLGMAVMPFVHLVLRETTFSLGYIRLIFFLWLVRTVLSYLLSYKRSILIADQKEYLISIITLLANVLNYGGTIVILEVCGNYVLALSMNILVEAATNLWIAGYVNRAYPFLKKLGKKPLQKDTVTAVADSIKNIFVMRLFTKLLVSTDKMIISGLITTVMAGLYTNYTLVTQSVLNVMTAFSGALKPTAAQVFLEEDKEKDVAVLRQITFLFFLLGAAVCSCIFCLITPFVRDVWLNETYLMSMGVTAASVLQLFVTIMALPLEIVMNVSGLFSREKKISVVTALVNLVISLLLVRNYGVVGVAAGSILAYLVQIGCRILVFFKEYIGNSPKSYLGDMAQYSVSMAVEVILLYQLTNRIYQGGFLSFCITAVVLFCVICLVNVLLFCRTWRFRSILGLLKQLKAGVETNK